MLLPGSRRSTSIGVGPNDVGLHRQSAPEAAACAHRRGGRLPGGRSPLAPAARLDVPSPSPPDRGQAASRISRCSRASRGHLDTQAVPAAGVRVHVCVCVCFPNLLFMKNHWRLDFLRRLGLCLYTPVTVLTRRVPRDVTDACVLHWAQWGAICSGTRDFRVGFVT